MTGALLAYIENKLHNTQDFGAQGNLIEFDYFMDDEELNPYHDALNEDFPEDWFTNTEIENNLQHAEDVEANEDLIDLEHYLSYEELDQYHAALNDEFPEDWLTNTAETDIMYSINPYL